VLKIRINSTVYILTAENQDDHLSRFRKLIC